jgi:hypothetical protein
MPPRKSDASKAATGDEGTPAKEAVAREGINIEVLFPLCFMGFQDSISYSRPDFDARIGSQSSQEYSYETG